MKKIWLKMLLFCVTTLVLVFTSAVDYLNQRKIEPIVPAEGVKKLVLSEYFPKLKGTAGDTEVFIIEGKEPGGTALVVGGTHPNEPAGYLACVLLVESCQVKQGKLIVIPRANMSAFSHTQPLEGTPKAVHFKTRNGNIRYLRVGSRLTNPVHQWPDANLYVNSGQVLSGSEQRNLNRTYPGNPNGTLTEQVAYAIMCLIQKEKPSISIDLHEASPEYTTVNALVAHERAIDIAVETSLMMELEGIQISVEQSPKNFSGLSHREWGDHSETLALLAETANPSQGRLRGRTDEKLVITGKDKFYIKASSAGRLRVPYDEKGLPLEKRVGRHLVTLKTLLEVYSQYGEPIEVDVPSFSELMEKGIGYFLNE